MTCDWKTLNKNPCLKTVCVVVNRDGKSHAALRDTSWVKREKAPAVVTWCDAFWLSLIEPDWKIFSSLSWRAVGRLDQYISIKDNLSFFYIPGIQVPWLASARPSVCSGERMSGWGNQWDLNTWNKLGSHRKVALPVFTIAPALLDFRKSNLNHSFLSLFPRFRLFPRLPSDRFSLRSQTMQMDKGI